MPVQLTFEGFPEGKVHLTPVPEQFFLDLLPAIDDITELKVTLYVFWRLDRMEGKFRYLLLREIGQDERFMSGLGDTPARTLEAAINKAVARGTLLAGKETDQPQAEPLYFLNSPKGRAAIEALQSGAWRPGSNPRVPVELTPQPANIFKLFEENISPLTPMLAEALRDAENEYPALWIEDAIRIAVKNNKRNWNYIQAILRRWQREGRDERQNRLDTEENRRRYSEWDTSDE